MNETRGIRWTPLIIGIAVLAVLFLFASSQQGWVATAVGLGLCIGVGVGVVVAGAALLFKKS